MATEKLDKWAELLLDTGKRNNLINFKTSASSTVEIIAPDILDVYSKSDHAVKFEVFEPKAETHDFEDIFTDDKSGGGKEEKIPTKGEYFNFYAKKLKKNQLLAYNTANKPRLALRNISKKAKLAIEETGINIAYMAFGFIKWSEKDTSQGAVDMLAPLLLVPISIEQNSLVDPYVIKITDDDTVVNPTFAYLLQTEYGINLPEYEDFDSIGAYFDCINGLISRLKWSLVKECHIGVFSFQKINMYKDMKDNAKTILRNCNVEALLGIKSQNDLDEKYYKKTQDLLDLNNVVDADSSQAEAIDLAKSGRSFVLQGPPGTGKSQTITNIIAECLYDGKKVLFVSEKLAALNVVYDKLKSVGLEEFCLELHSHKANKKDVIDELCRTLKLPKSGLSEQANKEQLLRKESQKLLDDYNNELHKLQPIVNKSVYEMFEEVASCRDEPELFYPIEQILSKGEVYIDNAVEVLSRYAAYAENIGEDYHKYAWYGYANTEYSHQTPTEISGDLSKVINLCRKLNDLAYELQDKYGFKVNTIKEAEQAENLLSLLGQSSYISSELLKNLDMLEILDYLKMLKAIAGELLRTKAEIDTQYDEDIYKLNGEILYKKLARQYKSFFSRLFSGEYKKLKNDILLCQKSGNGKGYGALLKLAENLDYYQQKLEEYNSFQAKIAPFFEMNKISAQTDFELILSEVQKLFDAKGVVQNSVYIDSLNENKLADNKTQFIGYAEEYRQLLCEAEGAIERLQSEFDKNIVNFKAMPLGELLGKMSDCYFAIDKFGEWVEFLNFLKRLEELNLKSFVDFAIAKGVQSKQMANSFKKTFYTQWLDNVVRNNPTLFKLTRIPHDDAVKCFKAKDELNFEINKAKIKAKLSAERPNLDIITPGSSIAVLLREGEKKRKQKSIRTLLAETGDLVKVLKPCFLMSPLSVSTFLSPEMTFDVVIFDEASQIFPQDAIGAIYRANQLIVVGDSKQMPPSNFFTSSMDAVDDENADDVADFDSILDLCTAVFPERRLKWHYRSRHEQLIMFSNKNFYDNDLTTFPATKQNKKGEGIDFELVSGVFDRKSKTNRIEAEKVVDLVFENIEKYPHRSLGVVTFSISQQSLIEQLIAKRRQSDNSKEEFFRNTENEPFFIKNLETVQGDERDTIIFSVAYAKDAQGKFLHNFGPLNRVGGERRLNVAVTRAKVNVILVSSIRATDIDLTRTGALGSVLLREYLDYAENGSIALERNLNANTLKKHKSDFDEEVCDFLTSKGYSVDTEVGSSSFKIDLAVKRPDSSDYVLAIECDGATYHSSKTARDRDRLRQEVLERMGWKFYRIWSTDWFRNNGAEKERLLTAVNEALNGGGLKENRTLKGAEKERSFAKEIEVKRFAFPTYQYANIDKIVKAANYRIPLIVRGILETEAPLAEEWLIKRICYLFGGTNVTDNVRKDYLRAIDGCENYGVLRHNDFLYVKDRELPMLRVPKEGDTPRELKYIDLGELANGLRELIKQNITVDRTGLYKTIVQQLGYSRLTSAVTDQLDAAMVRLNSEIEIEEDNITMKKQS